MQNFKRKITKSVQIGSVQIGGGAPVSVQSMCNSKTEDAAATLAQLHRLHQAGAQIGRLAVPHRQAAEALPTIVQQSPLPLVADIHFDHRLALQAVRAGVAGLRINPGNIGGREKVRQVAEAAAAAGIPIRIGVNGGSLEQDLLDKHAGITAEAMVESALRHAEMLEDVGFFAIKLSLKASDVPTMVQAYRLISEQCDYPLHIGVTETGTLRRGSIKSAVGLGTLLMEGIGDTMRISLTDDPVKEVELAQEILAMLSLQDSGWEFVSCPTCGRTEIDLIRLAQDVEQALAEIRPQRRLKVAVMGCAVNGPGEAKDADLGIAGVGEGGVIFRRGEKLGFFPAEELLDKFVALAEELAATQTAE